MLKLEFLSNMSIEEIEAIRTLFYRIGRENFWKILMLLNTMNGLNEKEISEKIHNTAINKDLKFMMYLGVIKREQENLNDPFDYTFRYSLNIKDNGNFRSMYTNLPEIFKQIINTTFEYRENITELMAFAPRKRKKKLK